LEAKKSRKVVRMSATFMAGRLMSVFSQRKEACGLADRPEKRMAHYRARAFQGGAGARAASQPLLKTGIRVGYCKPNLAPSPAYLACLSLRGSNSCATGKGAN
jgi:hypothetical protein